MSVIMYSICVSVVCSGESAVLGALLSVLSTLLSVLGGSPVVLSRLARRTKRGRRMGKGGNLPRR